MIGQKGHRKNPVKDNRDSDILMYMLSNNYTTILLCIMLHRNIKHSRMLLYRPRQLVKARPIYASDRLEFIYKSVRGIVSYLSHLSAVWQEVFQSTTRLGVWNGCLTDVRRRKEKKTVVKNCSWYLNKYVSKRLVLTKSEEWHVAAFLKRMLLVSSLLMIHYTSEGSVSLFLDSVSHLIPLSHTVFMCMFCHLRLILLTHKL